MNLLCVVTGESKSCEDELCRPTVTFLDLKCGRRKRKNRHVPGSKLQTLMSAEFEMQVRPVTPTGQPATTNLSFVFMNILCVMMMMMMMMCNDLMCT